MTLHLGTDLVYIPRLARSLEMDGFVERVFTAQEQRTCRSSPESFAARWAAKEATVKAFGCGIARVPLRDIEVIVGPDGAPALNLAGAASELAAELRWSEWAVSLSHDGDYAIAVVVAASNPS